MRNKILTALLAAALALQGGMAAAAQEYTTEGTAECRISCLISSSYTVSIPAAVEMSYSPDTGRASGSFRVGVKGDLLLNQMVQVKPTTLTEELSPGIFGDYYNGSITGEKTGSVLTVTVNQKKTLWYPRGTTPSLATDEYVEISASEYVYAEGTVTTGEVKAADTYAGTLVFAFGLKDYKRSKS